MYYVIYNYISTFTIHMPSAY